MTRNFDMVSRDHARLESRAKTEGKALYTDDLSLPRMAWAVVVRSPFAAAEVTGIDFSESEKIPGYLGALLPEEVPDIYYNCSGNPPSPLIMEDERILTTTPKCAGDRIVAVAAETKEAALESARAVKVNYAIKKPIFKIREAFDANNLPIEAHLSDSNVLFARQVTEGDIEKGFKHADLILEDNFYVPPVQHLPLELTACICDFSDGMNLTIWSNSQTIFQERRILSVLCGIPENRVRVIKPTVGGGFGARQQTHAQPVCALLSKKVRRPLKLIYSREEEQYATTVRHEAETQVRIGAANNGTLCAFYAKYVLNTGPYTTHGPTVMAAAARKFQYKVPDYFFDGFCVLTNHVTAGAFRGYGNTQIAFAREVMIERVAEHLGTDSLELRIKNHVGVGEHFPGSTTPITSCQIEQCVTLCEKRRREIDDAKGLIENNETKQAWGVAFACHGSGPSSKEGLSAAVVMLNDDGSIQLLVGSADIGQGSETMLAQIAAETLGITLEAVNIIAADTGLTPYDTGTFGSSQTFICGNAVLAACRDLLDGMVKNLNRIYETSSFAFREQVFTGNSGKLSFQEAAEKIFFHTAGGVTIGSASYKARSCPNPFAVTFAKAEYHKKTNAVRILHVIESVDVGTPINPLTVKGQIEGGVAQGVGYALMEMIEIDPLMKKPLSSDLLHYKAPLFGDIPEIDVFIAKSYEADGPYGAKSVGELVTVPVAPAIVNAVRKASGQNITSLPLCKQFLVLPSTQEEE